MFRDGRASGDDVHASELNKTPNNDLSENCKARHSGVSAAEPEQAKEAAFRAVAHVPASRRKPQERDDAYPVLVRFDTRRVIRCQNDLQWILQTRSGHRWRDLGYFRNKDVLLERIGSADAQALATLRVLA